MTRVPEDSEQIIEPIGYDFGLSRRGFVQILGAGILIAASSGTLGAQEREGQRRGRGGGEIAGGPPVNLDARLHIGKDGTITVLAGKVEGGQGARAELTQAAAEELGVAVEKIHLILADTALVPNDGITAGSRTTPATVPAVRSACATARKLLDDFISHSPVAKNLTYADLASDEKFLAAAKQSVPRDVELIAVKEWKTLGAPTPRPNARDIVTGAHTYPSDQTVPGMLYGRVLRPKTYGAKLKSIDLAPAKEMDGVIIVQDGDFVGVAGPTNYLANKAVTALEKTATWDSPPHPDSKTLPQYLREHARGGVPEHPFADLVSSAAKSLKATYYVPYVQHAPMEPRAALAQWEGDKLTVWTASQNPFGVRRELAGAFHMPEDKVRVIIPDFGGGFGGKHTGECAVEAARLAKGAGKPVGLHWTRAEEFTWAYFRPAALIDLTATLDKDGAITSWYQADINYGPPGIEPPYRIAKHKTETIESAPPLRHGSYRALAATANNFARESFMDELSNAAGKHPLEFRLAHLENPRLRAVLEEAARQFDFANRWSKKESDTGVGIACATEKGSNVAACVEVKIDRAKNLIRVMQVCQAFECGAITNPANLLNQNQGAIIQSLGPALREESQFENGRISNASFWEYLVPRFEDVPKIEVHLINRPDLPSAGAGETPLIAIAPAIGNAVFHATSQRLREMPMKTPSA